MRDGKRGGHLRVTNSDVSTHSSRVSDEQRGVVLTQPTRRVWGQEFEPLIPAKAGTFRPVPVIEPRPNATRNYRSGAPTNYGGSTGFVIVPRAAR